MAEASAAAQDLEIEIEDYMESVNDAAKSRAFRTLNVMFNSAQKVLSGPRSGRRYKLPYKKTYYTASAEGEAPAVRTGNLRRNWRKEVVGVQKADGVYITHKLISGMEYAWHLEHRKRHARPFADKVVSAAMPDVEQIYEDL